MFSMKQLKAKFDSLLLQLLTVKEGLFASTGRNVRQQHPGLSKHHPKPIFSICLVVFNHLYPSEEISGNTKEYSQKGALFAQLFNGNTGENDKLPTRGVKDGCSAIKIYCSSSLSSPSTLGSRSVSHELRLLSGGDGTKKSPPPSVPLPLVTIPGGFSSRLTRMVGGLKPSLVFTGNIQWMETGEEFGSGSLRVVRHSWEETSCRFPLILPPPDLLMKLS